MRTFACLLSLAAVAHAQPAPDPRGECTTTTTVTTTTKCTGDAAPLAVPSSQPQPELIPQPPPSQPPDCCCDRPPSTVLVAPLKLGDWHLVRGDDGQFYKERWRRKVSGMSIAGLVLLTVSEVALLAGGLTNGQPWAGMPIFGPIMAAVFSEGQGAKVAYGLGAAIQVTSLIVAIVGGSVGERYRERRPVSFVPYVASTGGGVALSGRF